MGRCCAERNVNNYMRSLYIISEGADGPVKIGVCTHIIRRLKGLQVGNPRQLRLVSAFVSMGSFEYSIHSKLKDVRLLGEWFRLSEDEARKFIRSFLENEGLGDATEIKYDENYFDPASDNSNGGV